MRPLFDSFERFCCHALNCDQVPQNYISIHSLDISPQILQSNDKQEEILTIKNLHSTEVNSLNYVYTMFEKVLKISKGIAK